MVSYASLTNTGYENQGTFVDRNGNADVNSEDEERETDRKIINSFLTNLIKSEKYAEYIVNYIVMFGGGGYYKHNKNRTITGSEYDLKYDNLYNIKIVKNKVDAIDEENELTTFIYIQRRAQFITIIRSSFDKDGFFERKETKVSDIPFMRAVRKLSEKNKFENIINYFINEGEKSLKEQIKDILFHHKSFKRGSLKSIFWFAKD